MFLSCKDISKSFGIDTILDSVTFTIDEKDKIAIVGVNGAGKTTLFKIITNQLSADGGQVVVPKEIRLGYLSQMSEMKNSNTISQEMITVFQPIIDMEQDLREMEANMSRLVGEELEALMNQYSQLSHAFEEKKGYEYKSRVRGVIRGLGFTDEESVQQIGTLSGGQKTRVSLGKLLLTEPDMLLLDEPTNHLDIDAIQWLEDFLNNYSGGVIIISHDRYFLDKIVHSVIEIENKKATIYQGNYTLYARKKIVDREIQFKHFETQQKEIKRQEEVIQLLKSFNREKSVKRAESRERMLGKMEKIDRPQDLPDQMRMSIKPRKESGNDVLFVEDVSKSFDDEILFQQITFDIKKGEKVALIGPNGIGKTTLFRMILEKISVDSGKIKLGSNVVIGYYDQEHQDIREEKTIFNEIADAYPRLTNVEIRNTLAAFLFSGDDVFKQISTLSGGERGRVALAKIMLGHANFLILDEPTNHLDVFSKEILEETLRNYTGTILYISHDRYFINNTSTKIIELSPNRASVYLGNYDYYVEKKNQLEKEMPVVELTTSKTESKDDRRRKKESQAEERRIRNQIEKTERSIEQAEAEINELDHRLTLESVYADPIQAKEVFEQKRVQEELLKELYEKWELLSTQESMLESK